MQSKITPIRRYYTDFNDKIIIISVRFGRTSLLANSCRWRTPYSKILLCYFCVNFIDFSPDLEINLSNATNLHSSYIFFVLACTINSQGKKFIYVGEFTVLLTIILVNYKVSLIMSDSLVFLIRISKTKLVDVHFNKDLDNPVLQILTKVYYSKLVFQI